MEKRSHPNHSVSRLLEHEREDALLGRVERTLQSIAGQWIRRFGVVDLEPDDVVAEVYLRSGRPPRVLSGARGSRPGGNPGLLRLLRLFQRRRPELRNRPRPGWRPLGRAAGAPLTWNSKPTSPRPPTRRPPARSPSTSTAPWPTCGSSSRGRPTPSTCASAAIAWTKSLWSCRSPERRSIRRPAGDRGFASRSPGRPGAGGKSDAGTLEHFPQEPVDCHGLHRQAGPDGLSDRQAEPQPHLALDLRAPGGNLFAAAAAGRLRKRDASGGAPPGCAEDLFDVPHGFH